MIGAITGGTVDQEHSVGCRDARHFNDPGDVGLPRQELNRNNAAATVVLEGPRIRQCKESIVVIDRHDKLSDEIVAEESADGVAPTFFFKSAKVGRINLGM